MVKLKSLEMEGSNIFCLFPGKNWGTSEDKITMIIAHWDTVKNSPGFDDNGSGMSAILEIARALGTSQCEFENSILLAALDLEEIGTHGAVAFVNEFVVDKILKDFNYPEIYGMIVLDSIMTYNNSVGSQTLSDSYFEAFPEASKDIQKKGSKGNFISKNPDLNINYFPRSNAFKRTVFSRVLVSPEKCLLKQGFRIIFKS